MLMPAHRMLETIGKELEKLVSMLPASGPAEGSPAQSLNGVLRLLKNRQQQGVASVHGQFRQLATLLASQAQAVAGLESLTQEVLQCHDLAKVEQLWRQALRLVEDHIDTLNQHNGLDEPSKNALRSALIQFEVEDADRQYGSDSAEDTLSPITITAEKLAHYLQDRFQEPELTLLSMQPLAGGFGKETIVFSVAGKALNGEFVMRRDIGDNAGLANDCHLIGLEYPVIKAVFDIGFPAPEVLWLDSEHLLLPGSDFIIMRRSPGKSGGSIFGASGAVSSNMSNALANIAAQLHTLPPLQELGDLNESIGEKYWSLSQQEVTRTYIRGWYDFWRSESHNPSPALASLYAWLLDHVPARTGAPSLLHGDIGYHNFLMVDGEISTVLDWEFAHVGDPAEDLGYIKMSVGSALDWSQFMASYQAAGGEAVDDKTVLYFQVWSHVRNASAANIISNRFVDGLADDLKLSILPYMHVPRFIEAAQDYIEQGDW